MADPIVVPPIVADTVRAALVERDRRGGLDGMTRTAALTAAELASSPITTPDVVVRVASWHRDHPEATRGDGATTALGGVWGGRAGRDWATAMAIVTGGRPEPAKVAAAPMNGGMVALFPDDPGPLIVPGGDPAEELHVTLAYVAQDAASVDEQTAEAIDGAAQAGAKVRSAPLVLTVVGCGQLGDADPPATVLILQQNDDDGTDHEDGAAAVADAVRNALDAFDPGAFPAEHDAFIPHLTIGYGVPLDDARRFVGRQVSFSAGVSVVLGDHREDHRWSGGQVAAVSDPLPILGRRNGGDAPKAKARNLKRLSARLNRINRHLRSQLQGGAEVAVAEGLRKAGVKVDQRAKRRSKAVQAAVTAAGCLNGAALAAVGLTEQEALDHAFDSFGDQAEAWMTEADRKRVKALQDELDLGDDDAESLTNRYDEARGGALAFLLGGLTTLAFARLSEPHPHAPPVGEGPVAGNVPGSLVTDAMAMADGRADAEGVPQPFSQGITLDAVAADVSDVTETITWIWGGSLHAFEPHADLDGSATTSDAMYDDWGKDPGEFPYGNTYWYPGDHEGCQCDWESAFDVPGQGGGQSE